MIKAAGLYARVSTTRKDIDVQLDELCALAQRRGWTIARRVHRHRLGVEPETAGAFTVVAASL